LGSFEDVGGRSKSEKTSLIIVVSQVILISLTFLALIPFRSMKNSKPTNKEENPIPDPADLVDYNSQVNNNSNLDELEFEQKQKKMINII
jgi:hypothetical protein